MSVFVDTSAFLAIVGPSDTNHAAASTAWETLTLRGEELIVTNYILLETFALVQRRFGLTILRALQQTVVPYIQTYWVDASIHALGVVALLAANRRQLSLVDCTSFQVMRQLGIDTVFAFDEHFAEQQFSCIP
jgi:predicted nucleic acid-binding protein